MCSCRTTTYKRTKFITSHYTSAVAIYLYTYFVFTVSLRIIKFVLFRFRVAGRMHAQFICILIALHMLLNVSFTYTKRKILKIIYGLLWRPIITPNFCSLFLAAFPPVCNCILCVLYKPFSLSLFILADCGVCWCHWSLFTLLLFSSGKCVFSGFLLSTFFCLPPPLMLIYRCLVGNRCCLRIAKIFFANEEPTRSISYYDVVLEVDGRFMNWIWRSLFGDYVYSDRIQWFIGRKLASERKRTLWGRTRRKSDATENGKKNEQQQQQQQFT